MAPETTLQIPEPPKILPTAEQKAWRQAYESAYAAAKRDKPNEGFIWPQTALREANRILSVPELKSYADAKELKDWQVLQRAEKDGQLLVVTIDGRKYAFDVPRGRATQSEK